MAADAARAGACIVHGNGPGPPAAAAGPRAAVARGADPGTGDPGEAVSRRRCRRGSCRRARSMTMAAPAPVAPYGYPPPPRPAAAVGLGPVGPAAVRGLVHAPAGRRRARVLQVEPARRPAPGVGRDVDLPPGLPGQDRCSECRGSQAGYARRRPLRRPGVRAEAGHRAGARSRRPGRSRSRSRSLAAARPRDGPRAQATLGGLRGRRASRPERQDAEVHPQRRDHHPARPREPGRELREPDEAGAADAPVVPARGDRIGRAGPAQGRPPPPRPPATARRGSPAELSLVWRLGRTRRRTARKATTTPRRSRSPTSAPPWGCSGPRRRTA